jgi:hypothetical protein
LTYAALIWWKRTHLTTVKKTVWSYPADYLLGYDRLYEHHTYGAAMETLLDLLPLQLVVEKEARQDAYRLQTALTTLKNQTGDILLFSRWQRKISQFCWLLLTVCYLWRYLIRNI